MQPTLAARSAFATSYRDCPQCEQPEGMHLEFHGEYATVYICVHCDTTMTIPPRARRALRLIQGGAAASSPITESRL
jgi:hypothetical protein